jgi:putative multiple sugar transport system permease protein
MERIRDLVRNNMRQYAMLFALIAIMLLFGIMTNGNSLVPNNVFNLFNQMSYILILATGMLLCILTGGNIDLAVGSVVAFVSASSAMFSSPLFWGLPAWLAVLMGLAMGLLAGMWQGFWIAYLKIPPFIVTLAGMTLFRGLNNMILVGQTIGTPDLYNVIGSGVFPNILPLIKINNPFPGADPILHFTTVVFGFIASLVLVVGMIISRLNKKKYNFTIESFGFFATKTAALFVVINFFAVWLSMAKGLPNVLILLIILVIIYTFLTTKTVAGRQIYALGGNEKAAELSGINTKKVMFWVYTNMGLLAGVAGIAYAGRLNAFSPLAGDGFELDSIAACFIGGASAKGGVGTVIGAIIGGLTMGILNQGMSIMGIDIFVQAVVKGLVILAAVVFDVLSKSKRGA